MVFTPTATTSQPRQDPGPPLHRLKQRHPAKRNHYSYEDFFCFQSEQGTLTDWQDARNILASEDFILALIKGLEQEVGSASAVVMYNIGKAWGQRDAKFFQDWFEKDYGMPLRQGNPSFTLEAWWWPFTSQGWGNWDVDLSDQKNGFMFINIFDSAVARTLGDVGKPVCHLYAGLFAGFFTDLIEKELSCIELQCYSMGETYCKFLLGKKDRIDAATFWQTEGATIRDIEKRLHNGEYLP
ncbi:MAG: V4R domain-containing protein [Thermosynechococcaceae cyanobacterium]